MCAYNHRFSVFFYYYYLCIFRWLSIFFQMKRLLQRAKVVKIRQTAPSIYYVKCILPYLLLDLTQTNLRAHTSFLSAREGELGFKVYRGPLLRLDNSRKMFCNSRKMFWWFQRLFRDFRGTVHVIYHVKLFLGTLLMWFFILRVFSNKFWGFSFQSSGNRGIGYRHRQSTKSCVESSIDYCILFHNPVIFVNILLVHGVVLDCNYLLWAHVIYFYFVLVNFVVCCCSEIRSLWWRC